jgi:hypothetical protein
MAEVCSSSTTPELDVLILFKADHFSLMAWRSPDPRSPELLDRGGRPFRAGETP